MKFDRFETRIDRTAYVSWPNGGGYQPIEFCINDVSFIELVRRAELPNAEAEFDAHIIAGEKALTLEPRGGLAGAYQYLPADKVFLPSRNLLGEPYKCGLISSPNDRRNKKSLLLQCTCGVTECWFLLATITVDPTSVTWSDFCQFHRAWQYDLGPFTFERANYEAQLVNKL